LNLNDLILKIIFRVEEKIKHYYDDKAIDFLLKKQLNKNNL
jgi:hypothetical protein